MKFWVGVTDNAWYSYLSAQNMEEVNFWQPSATPPFTNAMPGMPFLFKLKRPHNHIAGGGYFVTYSRLPISLAWEVFGPKNGCGSLPEFMRLLAPLISSRDRNNEIGCTVLASCFYLPQETWLENPPGWSSNIVRGKMYDTSDFFGAQLWANVPAAQGIVKFDRAVGMMGKHVREDSDKYGDPTLIRPRIGQAAFRVLVTDAYQRRCAITGENTLIALEAAHIVPYSGDGDHDVSNGLLLRADFHRLYDVGLVGVTPDLRVRISPRIRESWYNGKSYYRLDNLPLSVIPEDRNARPDPERLSWHMNNCYQA